MIAIYTSGNALWATVIPVSSMMRFDRFSEQPQNPRKLHTKTNAFAAFLASAEQELNRVEQKTEDRA